MKYFKNKTILITGGTGSFGSAFIKKILKKKINFKELRIFSRDEKKQDDMRRAIDNKRIKFYLGDVRDRDSLNLVTKNVDCIFHAAAYKQVPSCEFYPMEAVKTNIIGTNNLINIASKNKVKKIICLSTDKAVYPINAMGMSKALMEKTAVSHSLQKNNVTAVCVTRYGNIIGSRGSVIPKMVGQIKNNRPISITNENMTRFMMSLDDAMDLVLYAFVNGRNGQTFIRKAPSATLKQIYEVLTKIFGKNKYPKRIIGIRHGEKLNETLMSEEESYLAKENKLYFVLEPDLRDLNYDKFFSRGKDIKKKHFPYNSSNTIKLNNTQLFKILIKEDCIKNFK